MKKIIMALVCLMTVVLSFTSCSKDNDGKLSLAKFSKAGYDVPNAWFTIKGDFFLTKCSAEKFINR